MNLKRLLRYSELVVVFADRLPYELTSDAFVRDCLAEMVSSAFSALSRFLWF